MIQGLNNKKKIVGFVCMMHCLSNELHLSQFDCLQYKIAVMQLAGLDIFLASVWNYFFARFFANTS
jgi:hypothetical protein